MRIERSERTSSELSPLQLNSLILTSWDCHYQEEGKVRDPKQHQSASRSYVTTLNSSRQQFKQLITKITSVFT